MNPSEPKLDFSNPSSSNVYTFKAYKIEKLTPIGNYCSGQRCPKPRSGHRCVVTETNLYSFGGYNYTIDSDDEEMQGDSVWQDSRPLFRELWSYNFAARCWSKQPITGHIPSELASHAALLHGRSMLVYGGTGYPFGYTSSNSLHSCKLQSFTWNKLETSGEQPQKQYGQAIALHNNALFVVGGTTGNLYSMDVHKLDMKSLHWEKLPSNNHPNGRYRHEVAFHEDKMFLFGGGTAMECYGFRTMECYNVTTCEWETIKTLPHRNSTRRGYPAKRRCHSLVQMDINVYICGGYDGQEIFDDLWRFNLSTYRWTKLPVILPRPVFFHSAGVTKEGCMVVYGGVIHITRTTRTSDIYSVWLTVPSLKEMCWQAMLHYIPFMNRIPQSSLLELGIPVDLTERIHYYPECG